MHLLFAQVIIFLLAWTGLAFGGASTGDILIDSETGSVTTIGEGHDVNVETNVFSVDVQDGARVGGDIAIIGETGNVVNAPGHNQSNTLDYGSVEVKGYSGGQSHQGDLVVYCPPGTPPEECRKSVSGDVRGDVIIYAPQSHADKVKGKYGYQTESKGSAEVGGDVGGDVLVIMK